MLHWFKTKAQQPRSLADADRAIKARPVEVALWVAMAAAWTTGWCWLSVLVAERFAPVLVLPIVSGLVLGGGLVAAMRIARLASRRWLLAGALVLSLVLAVGQHYVWYLATQKQIEQSYATQLSGNKFGAMVANIPALHPSFVEFLHATAERGRSWFRGTLHGRWVWASWGLDAALQLLAACGVVWFAARTLYCPHCRSWYRMVRRGTLDRRQAAVLNELCGAAVAEGSEFQLLHCPSACGQPRLEWFAVSPRGRGAVWLDQAAYRRLFDLGILQAGPQAAQAAAEGRP